MTQAIIESKKQSEIEYVPFGSKDRVKLSLKIIRDYIAEPGKNGEMPDDRECMKFMMLCRGRQLDPFQGDSFMIPFWSSKDNRYRWALVTAHQAFTKRAEIHPEYNGKESGIIINPQECKPCDGTGTKDDKVCPRCKGQGWWDELFGDLMPDTLGGEKVTLVGGWCKVYYKTRTVPEYQRLKLGTYRKNTAQWNDDSAGMICKCAEAAALRSAFPNTIGGLYLRDEMAGTTGEFRRPDFTSTDAPALEATSTVTTTTPVETKPEEKQPEINDMIVAIRKKAKDSKLTEPYLMGYLSSIALVPAGTETLEECHLNNPQAIEMVYSQLDQIIDKSLAFIQKKK